MRRHTAVVIGLAIGIACFADSKPEVALDHVVLGISDLTAGMNTLEERAGVRPVVGGVHPDRGTWNALLSIGDRAYLEIIAPNPEAQALDPMFGGLTGLKAPTPILWLVRTDDADRTVAKLREAGYSMSDPQPGSRKMPDGHVLEWRTFASTKPPGAYAPFFIEWGKDSPHPSTTSPGGCHLTRLELRDPAPDGLKKMLALLGLEVEVTKAEQASLQFVLRCPAGTVRFP